MKRLIFLMPFFLVMSLSTGSFAADSKDGTRIVLRYRPPATPDFYVKYYFTTRIPMEQYHPSGNGNLVEISGKIVFDLSELPQDLTEKLIPMMEKLVSGEGDISGLRFNFSRAEVSYITQPNLEKTYAKVKVPKPTDQEFRYLPPTPHRDEAFYAGSHTAMHQPGMLGWMASDAFDRVNSVPAPQETLEAQRQRQQTPDTGQPAGPVEKKPEPTPEDLERESQIKAARCQLLLMSVDGMTRH